MVQGALAAAHSLANRGIDCEVIDLRCLKPLDLPTVLASVARTGRLVVASEGWGYGSVAAEVVAGVTQQGFHLLDAPPQRVYARETPIPYHPQPLGLPTVRPNATWLMPFTKPLHFNCHTKRKAHMTAIRLPQLGESAAEATIVSWLVSEGDTINADQDLVEVETEKSVMTVTAPATGIVRGPSGCRRHESRGW